MYLSFEKLTKRYGPVTALQEVCFSVERSQFVSVLGPSGCGKTTTLMLLAGFEQPSSGRILLEGKDLAGLPPEKREVGVVFQHYALFPHMTVAENIAFGLMHGVDRRLPHSEAMERVRQLLDMIDLASLGQRRPAELSAGQQQRVAIARSLAPQPRVLCLDEPLSALDALLRERLRLEIRRLQRKLGLTVLYVTHDQEEALAISDRVVVMNQGKVLQVGTPWEVYDRPASGFVAGFIGKGSLLEAVLVSTGPHIVSRLANGQMLELPSHTWCGPSLPRPGDRLGVMLRSERVEVTVPKDTAESGSTDQQLQLLGRLEEVEFLGAHSRLQISGPSGAMVATAPAADAAAWQARIGSQVALTCRSDDVRLMPWVN
jgi:ABC-type Fe3+/spermidine/putrescine transport system ATPase subunit